MQQANLVPIAWASREVFHASQNAPPNVQQNRGGFEHSQIIFLLLSFSLLSPSGLRASSVTIFTSEQPCGLFNGLTAQAYKTWVCPSPPCCRHHRSQRDRTHAALSYSFCCALERFALDPATRSAVLHSGCMNNFTALCAMSGRIMSRLAQFMYSVSCSPELVPSLVLEHDCMKVIAAVLEPVGHEEDGAVEGRQGGGASSGGGEGRKESLDGAKETCAALLFNLSTQVPRSHRRCVCFAGVRFHGQSDDALVNRRGGVATALRCWKQRHSQRWGIRKGRGRAGELMDVVFIFECAFQGLVAVDMADKRYRVRFDSFRTDWSCAQRVLILGDGEILSVDPPSKRVSLPESLVHTNTAKCERTELSACFENILQPISTLVGGLRKLCSDFGHASLRIPLLTPNHSPRNSIPSSVSLSHRG